jgi:hypothetical protein
VFYGRPAPLLAPRGRKRNVDLPDFEVLRSAGFLNAFDLDVARRFTQLVQVIGGVARGWRAEFGMPFLSLCQRMVHLVSHFEPC